MIFPKTSIPTQVRTSCQVSLNPTHKLSTRETGLIHTSMLAIFVSDPSIYPLMRYLSATHPSVIHHPPIHPSIYTPIYPSIHPSLHPSISAQATQCYWVARALCESAPREKSGKFAQKSKFKFSARNFLSLGKVCDHFCENAKHTDQRKE